jgi:cytoskeletal protein CcmA (bactofilin family)
MIDTKRLEGNIISEGSIEVASGTVVIGDICGTSATIAGAVKGNVDVNGPVIIDTTAIVKGSIKAKSIQVNTGAVVDGYCSLNYAGVDLDEFFEEK